MKPAERLLRLTRRVPEPANYYVGLKAPGLVLPANVLLFQRRKHPGFGPAHHHRFVLILNLELRGDVVLDDVFFRLDPGHALLVFPYQFHGYHFDDPRAKITWLFVTFETERAEDLLSLRNRAVRLSARAHEYAARLAEVYLSGGPVGHVSSSAVLLAALLLNELLAAAEAPASLAAPAGPRQQFLTRVARYVDARMHEGIGIKEIARHMAVSPSNLRLQFRRDVRMSLGRYLRQKRLLRAASLLDTSNMRLWAIAERCGFGTAYSLSRAFKHQTGLAPRTYRRRHEPTPASRRALKRLHW